MRFFKKNTKDDNKKNSYYYKKGNKRIEKSIFDCGIINYWWCDDNGAILTAYALQQILKKNHISSKLIDISGNNKRDGISKVFEKKYLEVTELVCSQGDYNKLNDLFDVFAVGSDQVFRAEWVDNHWFLDFVKYSKNKVAVSASFGKASLDISKDRERELSVLLSRFNAISIREKQGVSICEKLGLKATCIVDPVFCLKQEEYVENLSLKDNPLDIICVYFRDNSNEKCQYVEEVSKKTGYSHVFVNDETNVEDFLNVLKNSSMVVTDSYHGVCFSIIFNKQFRCIRNKERGLERFLSLMDVFEIREEFFIDEDRIVFDEKNMGEVLDYNLINLIIEKESRIATEWIIDSITKKKHISFLRTTALISRNFIERKYDTIMGRINNERYYYNQLRAPVVNETSIVCFGAGKIAEKAYKEYENRIVFFIDNVNYGGIKNGIPIYSLKRAKRIMDANTKILITTSQKFQAEIKEQLYQEGFYNIEPYKYV